MTTCPSCGKENPEGFQYCGFCTAPLPAAPAVREQRKTVTVLFCDVTGSTALGEATDPEALRALLARYFERMKEIVESHGGTVEKFIGDAVMAVFGVPHLHEDDALRACRAAVEMRQALPELGVQARIGLNTGEVVTGTAERLATGDAVNVAARLEQAAPAGEVLIGERTLALIRDYVDVEAVEPLEVRGKAQPVAAHRLLAIHERSARSMEAPMVGRERELQAVRDAFARSLHDHSCQLFTVLGAAGVGKSRLVREFLADVEARVVVGRCLSYGEGITYWPVVEVVKQLDALPSDKAAAAALRSLLGESEQGTTAEEIAWAFRKLLEEQAQARALVCVFDDIHWGQETFFELVEHVPDLSRDAPILLLCMARPELLDKRPGWGGGKLNATTVLLEPLSLDETDALLDSLGGIGEQLRERIRAAAEGNPLFVEEMLVLLRESTKGEVSVPPTIQALLAARLDQLDPKERSVLECGSVEGRVFHRTAVAALDHDETQLPQRLVSLVRKELLRPDRPRLPGDDAFRFRHLLIRDAAYEALPKATRGDLHERFAEWLEERAPELVELDEILGYHLEQAARYRQELGRPDAQLAERAAERLAAAGRQALWRADERAAAVLLERALDLTRPARFDLRLELDLAEALSQRDPRRAASLAEASVEQARAAGARAGEALARVVAAIHRAQFAADPQVDELEALALDALPLLEQAGDHAGLTSVWEALGSVVANFPGHYDDWAAAAEQAIRHARLAGQPPGRQFGLGSALSQGSTPADEALQRFDAVLPREPHPDLILRRAVLLAMLARLDEAWSIANEAGRRLLDLTGDDGGEWQLAELAAVAGDYKAAARYLRRACDLFEQRERRGHLAGYAPRLGRVLCVLGRFDEAEPRGQLGREFAGAKDVWAQAIWRQVQARVEAHRGNDADAERLAREAVAIMAPTDCLNFQGEAFSDLAEVLAAGGRTDEAAEALEQALDRYERKKNLAMVAQVRLRSTTLRTAEAR